MRRLVGVSLLALLGAASCSKGNPDSALCKTNADCQADELCVKAECVPIASATCDALTPCQSGQYCCAGSCSTTACCIADFECQGGYCEAGACKSGMRPACSTGIPCPSGKCLLAAGLCFECLTDADCVTADLRCSPSYDCVPATAGCTVASCAAQGKICAPEQDGCRNCVSSSECGDRVCGSDGSCTDCSGTAACGLGRVCTNGRCATDPGTPCATSAECGNGVCATTHRCKPCANAGECGSGRICTSGVCGAASPECETDAGCNPPQTICRAGLCEPGCTSTSCALGQVCSTITGRCAVTSTGLLDLGATCTAHADCASNVCWPTKDSLSQVTNQCSESCVRHDDCPAGFVCYELGDGNLCIAKSKFPTMTLDVPPGGACSTDFENGSCETGYCNTTTLECMEMCARDEDCSDTGQGYVCVSRWPLGKDADGDGSLSADEIKSFTQLCHVPHGTVAVDEPCVSHDDCKSGFCAQTPDYTRPPRCAQTCCTPNDCDPSRPICKPLDAWDGIRDSTTEPYGFEKTCLWAEYGGFRDVGEACGSDSECKSEICVAGLSGTKRCTQTCCTSRDCADYDWAESCRPPLTGSPTLSDASFQDMATSLGRVAKTGAGTFPTLAVTPICMPR